MKEMQRLESEYGNLIKRLDTIEEVGCFELSKVIDELKDLDSRVSLTYRTLTIDASISNYDKANGADIFRDLDKKIKDQLVQAESVYSARRRLLNYSYAQFIAFRDLKRENQKRINEYEAELDQSKAVLIHISDPFAQNKLEEIIRYFERHVIEARKLNDKYDEELESLERDCRVLLDGGRLKSKDYVDEEVILDEINREITVRRTTSPVEETMVKPVEETVAKPVEKTVEESVLSDKEETEFTPLSSFEERVTEERDLNKEDAATLDSILDEGSREVPEEVPASKDEEEAIDDLGDVKPPKEDVKEEDEEEEKVVKLSAPPRVATKDREEKPKKVEEVKEDEEELTVGEIEKEDRVFGAVIKPPKPSVWKKVGNTIVHAIFFLSTLPMAIHGVAVNSAKAEDNTPKEQVEETTEAEEEKDLNINLNTTDNDMYKESGVDVPVIGDVQKNNLNAEAETPQEESINLSEEESLMKFLSDNSVHRM